MSRSAASPRVLQLYSPRCPSPLGLPPLAPHMAFQDAPSSAFPKTPERYYTQHFEGTSHMRFPSEARRPLAGGTQRSRASPPAPLNLDTQHHPPATVRLPSAGPDRGGGGGNGQTLQPPATGEMRVPPSPTPSSTSSLSLYSSESAKKNFSIEVIKEEEEEVEERQKKGGGFCACFNFTALFGTKSKPNKILAPREPEVTEPAPVPQMVQTRRRPPALVIAPIDR